MSIVLVVGGIYNLAWGTWVILMPELSFGYSGMKDPEKPLHYPQLWQCIGMIVGVYGIAYILAGRNPLRQWPIVLVGLLGKVFGPIGLAFGVITGQSRPEGLITCLTNDLIWWVPFSLILWKAYQVRNDADA